MSTPTVDRIFVALKVTVVRTVESHCWQGFGCLGISTRTVDRTLVAVKAMVDKNVNSDY